MSPRLFDKILVANRGEIAVRVIRACRQLGIATVAVYSEADGAGLHVQLADEAYCIGPPPAAESYLNIDRILAAGLQSGADALHPGYGFLAENVSFARAVADAGLTWIGPPADVVALMGDKVAAKHLGETLCIPTLPSYLGAEQDVQSLRLAAEEIGYPLMIKAAAGGGGRGMRSVGDRTQLEPAVEGAKREALAAFGDDRIFLEKFLVNPRHIEIQVMADKHGAAIHLGERDCSLQRRHQKVVEEAPSPVITPELREAMGSDALKLARAAGYINAGTVEFLFSGDSYYFLEMNTRIQVEHPVTEMVTGLDLVALQIRVAAGEHLPLSQEDVELSGHAIEVRVYAEDPSSNFVPSTGRLSVFEPPTGPGIRSDVGVYETAEISRFYDPLLAKLIVHDSSRENAVTRLAAALSAYGLLGPKNNLEFLHWISTHGDFASGHVDINWIDRSWIMDASGEPPFEVVAAAALYSSLDPAAESSGQAANDPFSPWGGPGSWSNTFASTVFLSNHDRLYRVELSRVEPGRWQVSWHENASEFWVEFAAGNRLVLRSEEKTFVYRIARSSDSIQILHLARAWRFSFGSGAVRTSGARKGGIHEGPTTPMPGTIVNVSVSEGQRVAEHEPLVVLEAMKMEHVIQAPHSGIVRSVLVKKGDLVSAGTQVVELESD